MKSVLISIQPKWCELIALGKKTVEVRKTKPKIETPFKCYIYMTKSYDTLFGYGKPKKLCVDGGKVIGEFVCDEIFPIRVFENGSIQDYMWHSMERSCVPYDDISSYIGKDKTGYGWHISDLVIYDKPKELSEFCTVDNEAVQKCEYRFQTYYNFTDTGYIKNGFACSYKDEWCSKCKTKAIKRPPQSWCYVEERSKG